MTKDGRRRRIFGEEAGDRALTASASGEAVLVWLWVVGALAAAWFATYAAGGSESVAPHGFYVPLIIAAIRFGPRGALVVAVTAGLVVGPLMPLDVAAGTSQLTGSWITRMLIFVAIGQLTAYLARHSLPSIYDDISRRRTRREIATGLDAAQFRIEYQPVIDLTSGELVGVEALLRWDHPNKEMVPPDRFIPEAERAGCIRDLTRFVIGAACEQVAQWRRTVLAGHDDFNLAINLSANDLADDTLTAFISETLRRTGVPDTWIRFEVTETAVVTDIEAAIKGFMALRTLGVRLAIDDFGTGQSSFSYLHRFPVDALKIDRVFIEQLEHHDRGEVLVNGFIALAHAMGLVAIAEGIENSTQAAIVRELGCSLAQGFLFSRPLRPEDLETLLAEPDALHAENRIYLGIDHDSSPRHAVLHE
jgi:EAL domain-containing protein (putative c-di-GMP-specific phosphodiesterase class I)